MADYADELGLGREKGLAKEILNISAAFQIVYIIYSHSFGMMDYRIQYHKPEGFY